jgi:hypothetical protein
MAWIPGADERYYDTPFRGALVRGVVARPYGIANDASNFGLLQNAEGYVMDNLPAMKPHMKIPAVTEPLPPSIVEAIRLANKQRGKQGQATK